MPDERDLDYQDRMDLEYIRTCLEAISSTKNRALAERYVTAKKSKGRAIGTRKQYAYALRILDNLMLGRPYFELAKDDVEAFLAGCRELAGPTTVAQWARALKTFYRQANRDTVRPMSWWDAWTLPAGRAARQVVTDDEFDQLLHAVGNRRWGRGVRTDAAALLPLRDQAILWMMRDTGWRGSALCALNYGSVTFDAKGGAELRTPPGAKRLKTRAFEAYIVRAVPSLKAWMAAKPGTHDEQLFSALTSRPARGGRMFFRDINKVLILACQRAGLRRIRPHDFKHTRATEMARNGWNAAKMNKALWSPGSHMGAIYEHLNFGDIQEQVRRDAGADPLGRAVRDNPQEALATAVSQAVTQTMQELRRQGLA